MTDPRALADEAVLHLDRLGAVILDDVGDGPAPSDLAASAAAARDAVTRIGVAALTQLTGLVAGVADSMVQGTTEWSPSLGGTLMAAVDDLRHLVGRAAQFSDEDSEHLHHRAAELSAYVRIESKPSPAAAPVAEPAPRKPVIDPPFSGESPKAASAPTSTVRAPAVPIAKLFYTDQGPHVVSGGVPKAAGQKSDLLGRSIDALDSLTMKPFAEPIALGAAEVVPVEKLQYRGRAALQRAEEIRHQIRAAGGTAAPAMLEEIYDLIGLALKE